MYVHVFVCVKGVRGGDYSWSAHSQIIGISGSMLPSGDNWRVI